MKGSHILLDYFASVLKKDHMFNYLIPVRFQFAVFTCYLQLLNRRSSQWLVEVGWILVVVKKFTCAEIFKVNTPMTNTMQESQTTDLLYQVGASV